MRARLLRLFTVDAFGDGPFSGNPAAVVLLDQDYEQTVYQKLACEMNISETSFVRPITDSFENDSRFTLRWFTPTQEVSLCGHATLATAEIIFHAIGNRNPVLSFITKSGELICRRKSGGMIGMDFPQYHVEPLTPKHFHHLFDHSDPTLLKPWLKNLIDVCKVEVSYGLPVESVCLCRLSKKLLVVLDKKHSSKELENLRPSPDKMMSFHPSGHYVRGVCLTLRGSVDNGCVEKDSGKVYDFVSRYFAPWVGIPEDPATGSAHCALGPYWSSVLKKTELFARQCSKRGANFILKMLPNDRIEITGRGVVILDGHVNVFC